MAEKKKKKKVVDKMMGLHIKDEKKADKKIVKEDMSMAKKMKGKC